PPARPHLALRGRAWLIGGMNRSEPSLSICLLGFLCGGPALGSELVVAGAGETVGDAGEDVAQVVPHRDTEDVAIDDEGLQDGEALGSIVGAGKEVVLATERGAALLALDVGVRDRHATVVEEDGERGPLANGVGGG